ncbi:MAG: nitrile hydratase accessory protein [Defluviicoccus sp.]|nr:nitrile hydratase accessory protein [Defluviicoccus sp.]
MPELPWDAEDGPVFQAPWEATAFAMAVRLSEAGTFTWGEWVEYLSTEIAAAKQRGDPDLGDRYYEHWLAALEKLVIDKGLGSETELAALKHDWTEATIHTPHGQPIELKKRTPVD